jgi:hypothetical protein
MSKLIRTEIDGLTNTAVEVELTEAEIAEYEAIGAQAELDRAAQEAEALAKIEAKASGIAKLLALGLTEQEATALLG